MTIPAESMPRAVEAGDAAAMRAFNRFYTRIIGLLDEQGGTGPAALNLTQVRLLYEITTREGLTARVLTQELGLNAGYLSRVLGGFERRGLIRRVTSDEDGREKRLRLTAAGRRFFKPLYDEAVRRTAALIAPLDQPDRRRLLAAMQLIRSLLAPAEDRPAGASAPEVLLREHRPGDIGWLVSLHGELYHREYGWNTEFEGLVAGIAADFLRNFDPSGERAWIAELDGERVGCTLVVRSSPTVAKLRLVLVHPRARGLGLGRQMVQEAIGFARQRGYRELTLWTNDGLHVARAIYAAAGFQLVQEEPHFSFGQQLNGQYWTLPLHPTADQARPATLCSNAAG